MSEGDSILQQTYSRRGALLKFAELAGATALLSACTPNSSPATENSQKSNEAPKLEATATPTVSPTPIPTVVPRYLIDSRFMMIPSGEVWEHENWYPNFPDKLRGSARNLRSLHYKGRSPKDLGALQFLSELVYRRFGLIHGERVDLSALHEEIANDNITNVLSDGHCEDVVLANNSYKEPTLSRNEIDGLLITRDIQVGLLAAYNYPFRPRPLVGTEEQGGDVGINEWFMRYKDAGARKVAYAVRMKPAGGERWTRLGIGISRYSFDDRQFHVLLGNFNNREKPLLDVPVNLVERVFQPLDGTEKKIKQFDMGLDQEPFKSLIWEIAYH